MTLDLPDRGGRGILRASIADAIGEPGRGRGKQRGADEVTHPLRLADSHGALRPPTRVLFLCRHNRMRSPTAERIFSKRADLDVRSAGTAPTRSRASTPTCWSGPTSSSSWTTSSAASLRRRFAGHPSLERLICLDIPDDFTLHAARAGRSARDRTTPHLPPDRRAARHVGPCLTSHDPPDSPVS